LSTRRGEQIELTDQEAELLRDVLEEYVSDLRMEVASTESMDFREALKEKERILKELVERLSRA
jgi:hypothetical protein